jgi:hypothetical protein
MIRARRTNFKLKAGCVFFSAPVLLITVAACAQRHRYVAPDHLMPEDTRLELMRQLEAAEEIDESDARDPRISIIRKEDFFEQADKAERALPELMYGYDVPQSQLADALSIPPKSLSSRPKLT